MSGPGHAHDCAGALSEADFERLERLLRERCEAGGGGMSVDVAHGFLTAVVSGPRLVLPLEWLPRVLGGGAAAGDGEQPAVNQLLMALYQDVVHDLDHDHYSPVVLHRPCADGEPLPLPYGWCQGYAAGLQLHGEAALDAAGNDPRAAAWLTPIATFLAGAEQQRLDPPDPVRHRAMAGELGAAARELYLWWRKSPAPN